MYIPRLLAAPVLEAQPYFPVTVITGPRRSGKTQLCKHLFPEYKYVNLEDLETRNFAQQNPKAFIESLGGFAVIDEAQNVPHIFSSIQVAADENKDRRFIITGSSNFLLMKNITQSLAGRAALFTLLPFSFPELNRDKIYKSSINDLLWRGMYPTVIADKTPVELFYRNYVNTYVERDVRDLLNVKNLLKFQSFIKLVALRCGSEFNASNIAKEVGMSATTISEWLSILHASYVIYKVPPYFANINKRLTKMPKIYFYDTGLLAFLLGIDSAKNIEGSPFKGMLFENLAMGELIKQKYNAGKNPDISFYREYSGKEVDALLPESGGLHLFEIKAAGAFSSDFTKNTQYVSSLIPEVNATSVIYDGETMGDFLINIRDI